MSTAGANTRAPVAPSTSCWQPVPPHRSHTRLAMSSGPSNTAHRPVQRAHQGQLTPGTICQINKMDVCLVVLDTLFLQQARILLVEAYFCAQRRLQRHLRWRMRLATNRVADQVRHLPRVVLCPASGAAAHDFVLMVAWAPRTRCGVQASLEVMRWARRVIATLEIHALNAMYVRGRYS